MGYSLSFILSYHPANGPAKPQSSQASPSPAVATFVKFAQAILAELASWITKLKLPKNELSAGLVAT